MQVRLGSVQDGFSTGQMQYRWLHDRSDAGQDRCSTGPMQEMKDVGQVRYRTGQKQ